MYRKQILDKLKAERGSIGMEELHHSMESLTDDAINEIEELILDGDSDDLDEICGLMFNIQEHEISLKNFILYNAHTTLHMSNYLISHYYTMLEAIDNSSVEIPHEILGEIKNNINILLAYMEGIDFDKAMEWHVSFLLIGINLSSDDFDATKSKEIGRAIIKFADEEDAE